MFRFLVFGDITKHDTLHPSAIILQGCCGREHDPERRAVRFNHLQLAYLWISRRDNLFAVQVKQVLGRLGNIPADLLFYQAVSGCPQQRGSGDVGLCDHAMFVDGAVAHGGHVVQVKVARFGLVQLNLCTPQFVVLHLQFNLMHLQLVQRLPHRLSRQGFKGHGQEGDLLAGQTLGPFPQGSARLGGSVGRKNVPNEFIRVLHLVPDWLTQT